VRHRRNRRSRRRSRSDFGWLGIDTERRALDGLFKCGLAKEMHEVSLDFPWGSEKRPFTWDLERSLHSEGKLPWPLIPTTVQDTGNCVAAALAQAGEKRHVIELSLGREEETFREWYIPWIYAVSRNQVGGGMKGAGSTGAWGAEAVSTYGVLFSDDPNVPPYGGYSDRWGHRRNAGRRPEYQEFFEEASDNKIVVARLTEVQQMIDCLEAGKMITIASSRGFKDAPRLYKGFQVFVPSGVWYHQMHITDVMYDPFVAFRRQNQWGPDAHGEPLNGETPGGAWNLAEDLEREIRNDECEIYAYFDFEGEPSEPDPGIL